MERRGDFLGRVYDDWTHTPQAGPQASEGDSARYGTKDSTDQSGYTTLNPQSTASPHMSSQPSFAPELSVTSSQGSLYEQLGGLVDPAAEHQGSGRGRMGEGVERQTNGGATVRSPRLGPLDIPLPPSPIRPKATMARRGLDTEATCSCT
ncbi:hypothetical protein RSOLAG22IIIB_12406 [Rhizoctonia solani]|uniref:Uncharacterized protein n=1 Tax=Rhizoctonia solani TaxID=456999 RepID=A0A0K6GDT3_9AGAM|nr:hypothetical protein RSOLAG22IIIB_12406 [Rhizoctonia solani]